MPLGELGKNYRDGDEGKIDWTTCRLSDGAKIIDSIRVTE